MPAELTRRFIDALGLLETDRDPGPIADLFGDDADVGNVATTQTFRGRDGAREFWAAYRAAFDDVGSEFRTTYEADGRATLEWTTRASIGGGEPFEYDGVSLIEHDGQSISRFRAYFDPRPITQNALD